jgi:transposase
MSKMVESMGRKRPQPRRSFTAEFKIEIVELGQRRDRTVGQVSKDFDLTATTVREWGQAGRTGCRQPRRGLTCDERAELAALRRENRRLREDVEILKRATDFFAEETR